MSNDLLDQEVEENIPSELDSLKERATQMGLDFHPNIGVDKLKARINEKLGIETEDEPPESDAKPKIPKAAGKPKKSIKQLKQEQHIRERKEAYRLVRVVVNCMNPNKKDWEGEILTVANAVIGTVKKYVPFNIEAGYHVPHCIFEQLKERKYQAWVTKKMANGQTKKTGKLVPEFNVQVLDKLTVPELKELARKQAMNRSIDED